MIASVWLTVCAMVVLTLVITGALGYFIDRSA
jgi:lipoprotein signal peptidase